MGAFGALLQRYHDSSHLGHGRKPFNHIHRLLIHVSSAVGLLLLVVVIFFQLLAARREDGQAKDGPLILINLVSTLCLIQLVFLVGLPFLDSSGPAENEYESFESLKKRHFFFSVTQTQLCNLTALLLHYIHLVSGFWMLSHSIFLYQRLWRPITSESHSQHHSSCSHASTMPFGENSFFLGDTSLERTGSCWQCCFCFGCNSSSSSSDSSSSNADSRLDEEREGQPTHWSLRTFIVLAWVMPMLLVAGCAFYNTTGYETHR